MLVIDASAALYAASEPDGFDRIDGRELVAPPLMWSESTSALRQLVWREVITEELGSRALDALIAAPIQPRRPGELHHEAWAIAIQLGWAKTYDAEYVALARIFDVPLLTRDERLKRSASRLIDVVGPADLT